MEAAAAMASSSSAAETKEAGDAVDKAVTIDAPGYNSATPQSTPPRSASGSVVLPGLTVSLPSAGFERGRRVRPVSRVVPHRRRHGPRGNDGSENAGGRRRRTRSL